MNFTYTWDPQNLSLHFQHDGGPESRSSVVHLLREKPFLDILIDAIDQGLDVAEHTTDEDCWILDMSGLNERERLVLRTCAHVLSFSVPWGCR